MPGTNNYPQDKIEALEFLHDLLNKPIHEDKRMKVKEMIEAYKAEAGRSRKKAGLLKRPRLNYRPPGL